MKKFRLRYLVIVLLVCFAAAVGIFLWRYPNYRYRLMDRLSRIGRSAKLEVLTVNGELITLDSENLPEDCTLNQALMLINKENLLPDTFALEVSAYKDTDVFMNDCVKEAYAEIAARVGELYNEKLYIRSAYRTAKEQQQEIEQNGETATDIGASEHQAGLALDVYVPYFAGQGFLKSEAGQYVNSHCFEFGFIIRYPQGKQNITGIGFEPWHIRYVGKPHAEIMYKNDWVLEEYMEHLESGVFYLYDGYLISRQSKTILQIPEGCTDITVSPDNLGGYIVTARYEK